MIQTEQAIPAEHCKLYTDYLARVASLKKVPTIMWVILTYGNKIEMVDKEMHMSRIERLLCSGDEVRVKVAVEAMSRTLGEWRTR